jgi:hypothetical protein
LLVAVGSPSDPPCPQPFSAKILVMCTKQRTTSDREPDVLADVVGKPVTEFLSKLRFLQREITAVKLAAYKPEPKLTERLHSLLTEESNLIDQAEATCKGNGIPFWDALLGICMKRDSIPDRLLESAGIHGSASPAFEWILSPKEISADGIVSLINGLPEGLGLVVSSKVVLATKETAHIPMLDFRCPCSPGNARAIQKILSLLGESRGILVESGRSYHYYGIELLSNSAWTRFMAQALLFAPIVDPRYVAHRIADGECRLKIASSRESNITRIVNAYTDLH